MRAGAGEDVAAVLLRRAGFRIVARQARTWWSPLLDGEPHETEIRADSLVEADGELLARVVGIARWLSVRSPEPAA